jgi:hypothetical protein
MSRKCRLHRCRIAIERHYHVVAVVVEHHCVVDVIVHTNYSLAYIRRAVNQNRFIPHGLQD